MSSRALRKLKGDDELEKLAHDIMKGKPCTKLPGYK